MRARYQSSIESLGPGRGGVGRLDADAMDELEPALSKLRGEIESGVEDQEEAGDLSGDGIVRGDVAGLEG